MHDGLYRCDVCERWDEWGDGWRWRSSREYVNAVRMVVVTCSDECREVARD